MPKQSKAHFLKNLRKQGQKVKALKQQVKDKAQRQKQRWQENAALSKEAFLSGL
jgi:uncharacterized protein (UPF0335 family)